MGGCQLAPENDEQTILEEKSRITRAHGKEPGKLKDGAAWLALKTNARILPAWVEGTDKVLPNNKLPLPRLWYSIDREVISR